jgi:ATPase subunit of ABC transporter with duplicated ATPase domains
VPTTVSPSACSTIWLSCSPLPESSAHDHPQERHPAPRLQSAARQASVTINPGEKVGLVGRNGAGKSTLFGLLNGTLHEDGGDYSIPKQWRMGQVAQDMPETEQSATDFVIDGDTRLLAARNEVHDAEASDDGMRMAEAYMALNDAGEHDAEARAQSLILGLGFKVSSCTTRSTASPAAGGCACNWPAP